mmetsp:Transcript_1321/g.3992  ORF Transcript_1321/g.3992 Transcript_1321/m.3992 type:complete len:226 (-) Transcript_1321:2080-2757(-)
MALKCVTVVNSEPKCISEDEVAADESLAESSSFLVVELADTRLLNTYSANTSSGRERNPSRQTTQLGPSSSSMPANLIHSGTLAEDNCGCSCRFDASLMVMTPASCKTACRFAAAARLLDSLISFRSFVTSARSSSMPTASSNNSSATAPIADADATVSSVVSIGSNGIKQPLTRDLYAGPDVLDVLVKPPRRRSTRTGPFRHKESSHTTEFSLRGYGKCSLKYI